MHTSAMQSKRIPSSVRRVLAGSAAATLALTLAACASSGGGGGGTASGGGGDSKTFTVGTVQPLSGLYAAAGKDIVNALKAQAQIINGKGGILGRQIKVVSVDSASSEQKSISATQKLLQTQHLDMFEPDVIYGQSDLPLATGVLSVAICAAPDCGDGKKYPTEFTANPPASTQVPPVLAYAGKNGHTKIGIIATNDAQGASFTQTVQADAGKAGVTITKAVAFDPAATDITAQLQSLRGSGAQAVAAWSAGTTVDTVMKGMQSLGWSAPVLGTPTVFTSDVGSGVPTSVQKQLICLCYAVGTRQGDTVSSVVAPLVDKMKATGPIASMQVAGLAADTLTMAEYAYTKAGKMDVNAAAGALAKIGADSSYPADEFYGYHDVNPGFHGDVHSPADAELQKGFFAAATVSPVVDGTYVGDPFTY